MSAPRTLVVFHVADVSGPLRDLELNLDWLARAGALDVVVPGPGVVAETFGPRARVTRLRYSAITLPGGPVALARALRRLVAEVRVFRRHLRMARPDVVLVATTTVPSAALAARLERVPVIVYAAEILSGDSGRSVAGARAGRLLISLMRRLATGVLACSRAAARQFERRAADVTVAYPPIRDAYADGDGRGFRAANEIPAGEPLVVCVGSITRGRGQDVLIRALAALPTRLASVRCAFVGSPFPRDKDLSFRDALPRLARELGVGASITFVDPPERINDAYAAADVVVNPVRVPEAFGRASCEALVAGCPVVVSRVGAVPEVLRDGESALLVPPDDPEALASAIRALLDDPERSAAIVATGRREVLERFPPERSREAFKQVIEGVACRPGDSGLEADRR
jgi:glycosyltransferase involved in cell wall biosynthesis